MPLTLEVSMQGFTNLRELKTELEHVPTRTPESVIAWANEHPDSAWARHLARHSGRVIVEYVRKLIEVVVIVDQPRQLPKRVQIAVQPLPTKPRESRLHRNVKPVAESVRRNQLMEFFRAFAPMRLAYADVPELQNLFAEAERVRKTFNILT
jgi:hypothetical protein